MIKTRASIVAGLGITLMIKHITLTPPPRAQGHAILSSKVVEGRSVLADLRQAGAFKLVFPRNGKTVEAILVNTAGGITGGDRFFLEIDVAANSCISLTTQAAERAYRAQHGEVGHIRTTAKVADGGNLHWLPQELILYDRCALDRRLRIDLAANGQLLMVEPVIFGRTAMGEAITNAQFHDRIEVTRMGQPLYSDAMRLEGNFAASLARSATANGGVAMASGLYVAPDAEAVIDDVRRHLGDFGGASLLHPDVLALRLVAADSHVLRTHLLPVLDQLSKSTLPVSWRL